MGSDPPIMSFHIAKQKDGSPKDTEANIRREKHFVVNLEDEAMVGAMNVCAAALPYGESELLYAKITSIPSLVVTAPRLLEAPCSFECIEHSTLIIGNNIVVTGVVQRIHVRKDLVADYDKRRINQEKYNLVGRMQSPGFYCNTRDVFQLTAPSAESLRAELVPDLEAGAKTI